MRSVTSWAPVAVKTAWNPDGELLHGLVPASSPGRLRTGGRRSPPATHTVAPLPPHRGPAVRSQWDRTGGTDGDVRGHAQGPDGGGDRRRRRLPAGGADDDLLR